MTFDEAYRKKFGRAPFEGVKEWDGCDRYSTHLEGAQVWRANLASARNASSGAWPPPGIRDPSEGGRADSLEEREPDFDAYDPLSPFYGGDDPVDKAHAETDTIGETETRGTHMNQSEENQGQLALTDPPAETPAAAPEESAHPLALELAESMGKAPVSVEAFERNVELVKKIREAVIKMLIPKKHFGTMPGVPKPFLYESGAHELNIGFNVYPVHENREREGTDSFLEGGETFPVWEVTSRAHLTWRHNGKVAYTGPECVCSSAEKEFLVRLKSHQGKYKWIEAVPLSALKQPIMHQAQKRATVEACRNFSGAGDTFTQDPEIAEAAGKTTTPEQMGERKTERPVVKKTTPLAAETKKTAPRSESVAQPAPAVNDKPAKPTKERFVHLTKLCAQVSPRTSVLALMEKYSLPAPLLDVDCMKLITELEGQLKGGNT